MSALENAGFERDNQDHLIISWGDLMDRGNKPRECLQFVNGLFDEGRAILIKGNHETSMEEMLEKGYPEKHDYSNGTLGTLMDLFPNAYSADVIWEAINFDEDYCLYKESLIDYYESDKYIFTHGFIPINWKQDGSYVYRENWRECKDYDSWDAYPYGARWLNGIKVGHEIKVPGKIVVVGHYHTSWRHSMYEGLNEFPKKDDPDLKKCFDIYKEDGLIAIDGCTAYTGIVNILKLEEV